jgi:uncharacterized membrane protein YgaE (UPF0421/DUF939 family)
MSAEPFMQGSIRDLLRLGRRWWDRLVAADPGQIRLLLALRTTTAVALSLAVLHSLVLAARLPGTTIVLGLVESLFGSISVRDPQAGAQRKTLLLTPFPTAASFALGTALAPFRLWDDVAFLAVIFAAVYVRRYGPRATALGFLAFTPYFMGSYLHLPLAQLPYQMLSLAIGTGCAYIVRFHVVPAHPERMLTRALRSFDYRIDQLLAEIAAAVVADILDQRRRRRLRRQIGRLNDTVLIAEDQLDLVDTGGSLSEADRRRLRLRAFDVELAADRLAEAALRDLPPVEARGGMRERIAALRRRFRDPLPSLLRPPEAGAQPDFAATLQSAEKPAETAGRRFIRALAAMETAVRASPEPDAEAATRQDAEESAERGSDSDGADGRQSGGLRPTTIQAIQVTTACALAIVAGEFLSPQRWYWAVITAFVVFSGTGSRGDTLIKAGQRVVGTVLGVAAGIALAAVIPHDIGVSLLLIYVCVFLAYYLFQVAYGAMMFWISIIVALLYRMIGIFTPALLLLRIEETVIGAAVGVAVAILVLPTSTAAKTAEALGEFLQRLCATVEGAARHMAGERNALDSAGMCRDLDRAFQALRNTARPLASGLAGAVAAIEVRHFLVTLRACSYYARNLARLSAQPSGGEDPQPARALVETASRICRNSEALAASIERGRPPIAASADLLERVEAAVAARFDNEPHRHMASDRQLAALYDIAHIDEAIRLLERDLAARGRRRGASVDRSRTEPCSVVQGQPQRAIAADQSKVVVKTASGTVGRVAAPYQGKAEKR